MKKSFFQKLSGMVRAHDDANELEEGEEHGLAEVAEEEEGQLAIDMYQTPTDIIVKTMIPGVKPEDLDISITRDMVTVRGKREENHDFSDDDVFHKELYWGAFSRTITLPQEVEVEEAEATNKNGLLTIKMPKLDKHKQAKVKVKSL